MNAIAVTSFLCDTTIQRVGWTLVHTLWQGVAIAAALAVVLRLLRTAPASVRYAGSCAAMSMIVFAAVFTFTRIRVAPAPVVSLAQLPTEQISVHAIVPPPQLTHAPVAYSPSPLAMLPAQLPNPQPQPATNRILGYVVAAWAFGVTLMSLWHVGGWLWLRRIRRGAPLNQWSAVAERLSKRLNLRGRAVALIETVRIDVPAVVGVLRPVILVPAGVFTGLSPQQVEAILAHELAHVRRHDYLVNLIQSAVETLMFYHPATWWISAQIRQERENCCDDVAASICGDRGTYAAALAALEERRGVRADLALAASGGKLLARVRRVLNLPPVSRRSRARSLAAAALAIACAALPLAVIVQQNSPAKAQVSTATSKPSDLASAAAVDVPASPILPEDLKEVVDDYRTGPGDLLSVSITDLVGPGVETVKQVRVSDTGMISTPLVPPIKVTALTVPEMEKAVQKAYRDGNLIANAQVSVSVTEPKQRLFNVIGQVDKPGQYMITKPGLRLLDALAQSGARTNDLTVLRIIRNEPGGKQRAIEVPIAKLTAGDAGVNLVIKPGDTIIAAAAPKNFVKIVIGQDNLAYNGKPIDVAGVRKMFEAMSEAQRRGTVLEIAAASPDVTVERFFSASAEMSQIVQDLHLAYLSETGIMPSGSGAATKPSAAAAQPAMQLDPKKQYFILGAIARPGSYGVADGQEVNVKQAIAAAGGLTANGETITVSVARKDAGGRESNVLDTVPVDELLRGAHPDMPVRPGDFIMVSPPITGEYYMSGQVPRVGVYSLTARKISVKQAIAAAGGLEKGLDDAYIAITRRIGADREDYPAWNLRFGDLLSGKAADVYLQPNDVIRVSDKPLERARSASPATQPAADAGQIPDETTLLRIASVDAKMRNMLEARDVFQEQFERASQSFGPHHPTVVTARGKAEAQSARIAQYAGAYIKAFPATTRP
jgi:protein involved in polysaccharide export with SLBB domain/beta-lactamase regulating signal transducer with metallopeptidase domain